MSNTQFVTKRAEYKIFQYDDIFYKIWVEYQYYYSPLLITELPIIMLN
jgi:hypothetical protein